MIRWMNFSVVLAVIIGTVAVNGEPGNVPIDPLLQRGAVGGPNRTDAFLHAIAQNYPEVVVLVEPKMPIRKLTMDDWKTLPLTKVLAQLKFRYTAGLLNGRTTYIFTGFTDERSCPWTDGPGTYECRSQGEIAISDHIGFRADAAEHDMLVHAVQGAALKALHDLYLRRSDTAYMRSLRTPARSTTSVHVAGRDVNVQLISWSDVYSFRVRGEAEDYAFQQSRPYWPPLDF
jgi:hypothetical protein